MLELKNISYTVEGEKDIINDVSLKIEDGKFIVITSSRTEAAKVRLRKLFPGLLSLREEKYFLTALI